MSYYGSPAATGINATLGTQGKDYTPAKPTMSKRLKDAWYAVVDSRCKIWQHLVAVIIIAIIIFTFKRYVLKINKASAASDFGDAIAVVAVTVILKILAKIAFRFIPGVRCTPKEDLMIQRGWLPPPDGRDPALAAAYTQHKEAFKASQAAIKAAKQL